MYAIRSYYGQPTMSYLDPNGVGLSKYYYDHTDTAGHIAHIDGTADGSDEISTLQSWGIVHAVGIDDPGLVSTLEIV